jgi:hypothetical protein
MLVAAMVHQRGKRLASLARQEAGFECHSLQGGKKSALLRRSIRMNAPDVARLPFDEQFSSSEPPDFSGERLPRGQICVSKSHGLNPSGLCFAQ